MTPPAGPVLLDRAVLDLTSGRVASYLRPGDACFLRLPAATGGATLVPGWVDEATLRPRGAFGDSVEVRYRVRLEAGGLFNTASASTSPLSPGVVRDVVAGVRRRMEERMMATCYNVAADDTGTVGWATTSATATLGYRGVRTGNNYVVANWTGVTDGAAWPTNVRENDPWGWGTNCTAESIADGWRVAGYANTAATVGDVTFATGWFHCTEDGWIPSPAAKPEDRLREIIRSRSAPAVVRRKGLDLTDDFRELRARETLARVVGEREFRKFVRDGFVTVKARSGRSYQIFPGQGFTRVHQGGKEVERLCVVLNGQFPPTDSVIVRYLLILNDEEGFRQLAVKHATPLVTERVAEPTRPLADIYRDLKRRGHVPEYATARGGDRKAV